VAVVLMDGFAGKTVLITGASAGIGRALALRLAAPGVRLALNARNAAPLEEAARECAARGAEAITVPGDLARPQECVQLVASTVERFGGLDIVVNNAGITMWSRFDAIRDYTVFERVLAINYLAAVYLTAAALPHLKAARGLIVAVASVAGLTGVPERTAYAASKHALVGFFESLRIELAGSGVDVTLIAPDFVVSELHRRALGPDGTPLGTSPMQESRIMTAEACARLIVGAMRRRQRLLITSARGRLARYARLLLPALVDRLAARAIRERR
jgi:short-subunit dehydrogenase